MLNHIVTMGRLTADPVRRVTASGIPVTSFSIACDRDFKNADGEKVTDFIDIVAWRNTAEFVSKYFTKGRMAVVDGRLPLFAPTIKRRRVSTLTSRIMLHAHADKNAVQLRTVSAWMKSPQRFFITYSELDSLRRDGSIITSDIHSFAQLRLDERRNRLTIEFTWLTWAQLRPRGGHGADGPPVLVRVSGVPGGLL